MPRLIFALIAVAAFSAVAVWFADRPGAVAVDWQGLRVETSVAVLVAIAAAVLFVLYLVHRLWRAVRAAPGNFGARQSERRRRQGYAAFTEGMVAIAAGDVAAAQAMVRRIDKFNEDRSLGLLLSAYTAELAGDDTAAAEHFTAMLQLPATEFLGLRGLAVQAGRAGEDGRALAYADRALALRPSAPWALRRVFDLKVKAKLWLDAEAVLGRAVKRRAVGASEAARKRAVILLARARAAADPAEALKLARAAWKLGPDLTPAPQLVAENLRVAGHRRRAGWAIAKAWALEPHPALAEIWLKLHETDKPMRRLAAAADLVRARIEDSESRILLARLALAAGDHVRARAELEKIESPGPRACRLYAELDQSQYGDRAGGRQWIARAAAAPPDEAYMCQSCGQASGEWQPACPACDTFDALIWRTAKTAVPDIAIARLQALPALAAPET